MRKIEHETISSVEKAAKTQILSGMSETSFDKKQSRPIKIDIKNLWQDKTKIYPIAQYQDQYFQDNLLP